MCKDTKIRGLNPLKVVRPTPPNQAQTDKYLLRKWGKQVGLKSKDSNRNERKLKTNSINGSFQARLRTMFLHKDTHCSLSLSLFLLIVLVLISSFFFPDPFIQKFSSFIYSYTFCISTFHLQSSRSSLGHLSYQTPAEGGKRGCLAVNILFRGHFLINAADKAVASHLIRRQQVSFHRKLLSPTLTLSLNTILSTQVSRRYFVFLSSLWANPLLGFKVLPPKE